MVEGGMKCIKVLLFGFNLIFVLAAIALIATGAYVQIELKDYFELIEGSFSSAAALLIAVGVIIFFIATFGCCGAYRESHKCTMIFAVLLGFIFILEIAGGIAGFVLKGKVRSMAEEYMESTLKHNNTVWDDVQEDFHCCGITNSTDWEKYAKRPIPKSCCKTPSLPDCTTVLDQVYRDGCLDKFSDWLSDKIYIVGAIGIALAFVQILGIMFACCLARAIKKEYEVV